MQRELIYINPLSDESDVKDFIMEGSASVYFENGKMRMKNKLSEELGQKSNFVYWCPVDFPENIEINWKFKPIEEPGLCILFFAACGKNGEDLFSDTLALRDGRYELYHSGDINAYHVSYFRRKWEEERAFHTCNLRKSCGFHLVAQGADPIPDCADSKEFYELKLTKYNGRISFSVDDLTVFEWNDDGEKYGKILGGGKIGFRQMAPLVGEYSDLCVYSLKQ